MRIRPPSPALVISCLALLLALGSTSVAAVNATGNAVNIVDPVTAANKAKVDTSGKLQVAVNGTAGARPVAPAGRHSEPYSPSDTIALVGPKASPINVTSLSFSLSSSAAADATTSVQLLAYHVPSAATTCASATFDNVLWVIPRLTSAPFAVSFPTPLQLVPPVGTKGCLVVFNFGANAVDVNASGFVS